MGWIEKSCPTALAFDTRASLRNLGYPRGACVAPRGCLPTMRLSRGNVGVQLSHAGVSVGAPFADDSDVIWD